MMATIRNGFLWTCHHVGLDGTDGNYGGTASGSGVDRSGVQWFKLQVQPGGTGLSYSTHNRIYDAAGSSANWYCMPSLAVNTSGRTLFGFSCSRGGSSAEHIGALFTGRLETGIFPERPTLIQAGRAIFDSARWGDYSATSVDPDGSTFWTVQAYAERDPVITSAWGTWINSVKAVP